MHGRRSIPLLLALVLAACSTDPTTSTPTSGVDATPPATETSSPVTTSSPDTTVDTGPPDTSAPSTTDGVPPQLSVEDLDSNGTCATEPIPFDGQTTFTARGRLWGVDRTGDVVCLADLAGHDPSWISWSPDADEVLVGPDTVLRADGQFVDTGYFPDNRSLRWSEPTGKALIAPNASTGKLIWRDAHDSAQRIDVSFMERTTTAAYHPAGRHILAAGIGADGLGEGIFLASNRGANAARIGQIEHGEVTDLRFDAMGGSFTFVHRHGDGTSEVHRYSFGPDVLETLATYGDADATDLTTSTVDQGYTAWALSTSGNIVVSGPGPTAEVEFPASVEATPLSWLSGGRLLVAVRETGDAATAPFALWEWSPAGLVHVVDDVHAAAARTVHGPYLELDIVQGSGFG